MRVARTVIAFVLLGGCTSHTYEPVGTVVFTSYLDEPMVYATVLTMIPKVGYELEKDLREMPPKDGAAFSGLSFGKESGKYSLMFGRTKAMACYFFSLHAYDKERAEKAKGDLPLIEKELKATFGKELKYVGREGCPLD